MRAVRAYVSADSRSGGRTWGESGVAFSQGASVFDSAETMQIIPKMFNRTLVIRIGRMYSNEIREAPQKSDPPHGRKRSVFCPPLPSDDPGHFRLSNQNSVHPYGNDA